MEELKVTLSCGISVDFSGKLDEPFIFNGALSYMIDRARNSKNEYIREGAITEIEHRAIEYAHKALAGYNFRAIMADEAVELLMKSIRINIK